MNIQHLPLSKLVPSAANLRKTDKAHGVEQLAASIQAHGLLQNLQVKPTAKGQFEVVAGGRRLAALKLLAKQKKIATDHPIPCNLLDGEDVTEISLAENEVRQAMHPADQFDAFKALADNGKGEEEIAARFGVTPQAVRQRLKLAAVSPKLIALYRKGEMTLDCLMAFAVSDDHQQQEKAWGALLSWEKGNPHTIRDALTRQHMAAGSKLAQFVGLDTYEKAGGGVLRDLFDDESAGWITDTALLHRLAAEKLEQAAEAVRGEGWKWVEIVPNLTWETTKGYDGIDPTPTPEQEAEAEKLATQLDDMEGDEEDYEALHDRLQALQDSYAFTLEAKATAGAIVSIDACGKLDIRCGLIRSEDRAAARKADKPKAETRDAADAAATNGLSAKLVEELTAHRTAALQAKLADNPQVALVAVIHALAWGCLYRTGLASCVKIGATMTCLGRSAEGIDDSAACKQFAESLEKVSKGLPKQPEELWSWLLGKDQETLLAILAICAASAVDSVEKRGAMGPAPEADPAAPLAAALKLDMAAYWQPTAVSYFSKVSKALILEAVTEGVSREAAENLAALKKDALADHAEKRLSGTGWLPALLRAA